MHHLYSLFLRPLGFAACILWGFIPTNTFAQSFINRTSSYGLSAHCDGLYGNGISLYDWDHDGWDDITLCGDQEAIRFFKNNQGSLIEVELQGIEPEGRVYSANWVDFDNDGQEDLSVNQEFGLFRLYRNTGSMVFEDISTQAGFYNQGCNGYGHCWGDFDRDGWLDVYVSNYVNETAPSGCINRLYRNNGNGTFSDVSLAAGVDNGLRLTYIPVWIDYNMDGWPDLFVQNDRVIYQNYMYRNNGDGTFTDVSAAVGLNHFFDPMSGTVSDYNNDGFPDIYVTDTFDNRLYRHQGDSTFTDVAGQMGVLAHLPCWGSAFIDVNLDGYKDILFCTSTPLLNINALHLYQNTGSVFELNLNSGFAGQVGKAYALAHGDLNRDGKPDVVCHMMEPQNTMIWENALPQEDYIRFRLDGHASNRNGVGARVMVSAGGFKQYFFPMCGEQYLAQNSQWMLCGLGNATYVDSVVVEWPSGNRDCFKNLIANRDHVLPEGESIPLPDFTGLPSQLCYGDSLVLEAPGWDQWLWSDGSIDSVRTLTESGIYSLQVSYQGYASWVAPFEITFVYAPEYQVNRVSPSCFGGTNGAIEGIEGHPELFQGILNGAPAFFPIQNLSAGVYVLRIEANGACPYEKEILLEQPEQLLLNLEPSAQNCPGGSLFDGTASGGVPPYQWFWNLIETASGIPIDSASQTQIFCASNAQAALLQLVVTDANQCQATQSSNIIPNLGFSGASLKRFVFPNPFHESFTIHLNAPEEVCVYGITGHLVYQQTLPTGSHTIRFNEAAGTYFMTSTSRQGMPPICLVHLP